MIFLSFLKNQVTIDYTIIYLVLSISERGESFVFVAGKNGGRKTKNKVQLSLKVPYFSKNPKVKRGIRF